MLILIRDSGVAKEGMDVYVTSWKNFLNILSSAIGSEIPMGVKSPVTQLKLTMTAWHVNIMTSLAARQLGSVSIRATCVMATPTPSVGVMTRSWMIVTRPTFREGLSESMRPSSVPVSCTQVLLMLHG